MAREPSLRLPRRKVSGISTASMQTQRDGIDYNLAYIPSTFNAPDEKEFDTVYMRELFVTGQAMAARGFPWQKVPPGFEPPASTSSR
jgi:hypothetical protein